MNRTPYHSDLNDTEWQLLEPLLPPPKPGGCPIKHPRREIANAILYILHTGAAWRMLPHDLPPYRIVFHYYRTWASQRCPVPANPAASGPASRTQRRHYGQSIGENHRKKGAARLRRGPESDGAQASYCGGYGGAAAVGGGASGECPGPGWGPAGAWRTGRKVPPAAADLG